MKVTWKTVTAILLSVLIAVGAGCKKDTSNGNGNNGNNNGSGGDNLNSEVVVTTYEPQNITSTTVVCGGDAVVAQGIALTEIGVCWSTGSNPTIEGFHKSTTNWNAPFVCTLKNLEPETKYYLRAYALRGLICYYGEEKSFTTLPGGGGNVGDSIVVGDPSISVIYGENFLYDGMVIDVNVEYPFAFRAASNAETQKDLAAFKIYIDDELVLDSVINGNEFEYTGSIIYEYRDIIDQATMKAVVTDVAGNSSSATIHLFINQPEEPLFVTDFEWFRQGNTQTGLEEYGLYWDGNAKSPFALIKPLEGVVLYELETSVWDEVVTELQKTALFSECTTTISVYHNVDVSINGLYDDVIGTRMPDGTLHLLHVTSCRVGTIGASGTPIHIYGQAK